jgi:glutamate/aspartate transport system substrate-binding protein
VGATLKKIRDSGSITYGHREASFGFSNLDGGGKPVGYSIDICNRILEAFKTELKMPQIEAKYQNVTSQH